jgi:hypothetical protein
VVVGGDAYLRREGIDERSLQTPASGNLRLGWMLVDLVQIVSQDLVSDQQGDKRALAPPVQNAEQRCSLNTAALMSQRRERIAAPRSIWDQCGAPTPGGGVSPNPSRRPSEVPAQGA